MPEAKRPRGTSRSSGSKSTSRSTARGSRSSGASRTRGASSGGTTRRPAASKPRRDELEPLDLEGTDFEELLEASVARGRRAAPEPEDDATDADDLDDDDLEADEQDRFAALRPSTRTDEPAPRASKRGDEPGVRATSAAGFAATPSSDPITPLSERFGAGAASTTGPVPPVTPWSELGTEDDFLSEDGKPFDQLLAAGLGLALALATWMLPWYSNGVRDLSALAAGTLGVVTFIAGVGAFAIGLMLRSGVKVRFPLKAGVIIEGLAYLGIAAAILGRFGFLRPDNANIKSANSLVAVGIGIALVFVAARLTSGAPLMLQPGWMKAQGGRLGAMVLAGLVLLGGIVAAVKPGKPEAQAPISTIQYETEPVQCLKDVNFPNFESVTAVPGTGYYEYEAGVAGTFCGGQLESDIPIGRLEKSYLKALQKNGWTARVLPERAAQPGATVIELTAPSCGTVTLMNNARPGGKRTSVNLYLSGCLEQPAN